MTDVKRISIFDLYETDKTAEEDGKWFDTFGPEISLKIRRYSSKVARDGHNKLYGPVLKVYKTLDKVPENIGVDLTVKHLARFVVSDWKGVFDRSGEEITFSPEAAEVLFNKLPDFAKEVLLTSINMDNYRAENVESIKGN